MVRNVDAVVVGAGFAGLYMLHRLRGLGLSAQGFEAGDGVGGTWYWNRYPGARCDIESMAYSYQFSSDLEQEWQWSERYATQPEILTYINHVAERFDLARDIQFKTRVTAATYDESLGLWQVTTDRGETLHARYCIMALGCLSSANMPRFEGLENFAGDWYHTGQWPHHRVSFAGKRVGVVGTGSSAIQSIPVIAAEAAHLTVFQRTANYSVPAHNGPLSAERQAEIKANYAEFRGSVFGANDQLASQQDARSLAATYDERWARGGLPFWATFADLMIDPAANDTAASYIRAKIAQTVKDPETARLLSPTQVFGCKRLCVDTGYFETFNRPNVKLVDIRSGPIEQITPTGLIAGGTAYDLDVLVFATGFDAMTGSLHKIDIKGRGGEALVDKWAAGPRTYLGLGTAGFPNLFIISGPGSPSVLSNMVPSIEQHVNWIADCLGNMARTGKSQIEPTREAEDAWVDQVNAIADATLYPTCNSWYLGANVPGKPRVFMPYIGVPTYNEHCEAVVAAGYEGFELR